VAKKGHTEEQILNSARAAAGREWRQDGRHLPRAGVSEAFYIWKKEVRGTGAQRVACNGSCAKRTLSLSTWVADLSLDRHILQEIRAKNVKPRQRGELGQWMQTVFALSKRRVSGLMMINRST
jgi:hypothetical protein